MTRAIPYHPDVPDGRLLFYSSEGDGWYTQWKFTGVSQSPWRALVDETRGIPEAAAQWWTEVLTSGQPPDFETVEVSAEQLRQHLSALRDASAEHLASSTLLQTQHDSLMQLCDESSDTISIVRFMDPRVHGPQIRLGDRFRKEPSGRLTVLRYDLDLPGQRSSAGWSSGPLWLVLSLATIFVALPWVSLLLFGPAGGVVGAVAGPLIWFVVGPSPSLSDNSCLLAMAVLSSSGGVIVALLTEAVLTK